MEHIIIIVVAVIVDDDTYYWVYLSSDHLFQIYYNSKCDKCYYKVRHVFLLQSAMICYYKVRQLFYYKVQQVLQSVIIILQSATSITKCDDYYVQIATIKTLRGQYYKKITRMELAIASRVRNTGNPPTTMKKHYFRY